MRLVTFLHQNDTHIGALVSKIDRNFVFDFNRARDGVPTDLREFLAAGDVVMSWAGQALSLAEDRAFLPLSEVVLLPPVSRPGNLICVGHNYLDHTGGGNAEEYPTFFAKLGNCVIGNQQPIVYPSFPIQLDYEAELAVVIGKRAKNVDEARALDYVAGYTIFNDVTARDY